MESDEIKQLRQELDSLEREYDQLLESPGYRLGLLITHAVRSPGELPYLPWRIYRLWRQFRRMQQPPSPGSPAFDAIEKNLIEFFTAVHDTQPSHVVFMFSGTTFIQGTRGNRPIRQTQALLRRGIPVLFSYHRSRSNEPVPAADDPELMQIPVDITMQMLDKIADVDAGSSTRIFVVSYPYPGIETAIEQFRNAGWIVIYDCRDDWEEFSRVGMARWFNAQVERDVVSRTHVTMCVSRILCDKMARLSPGSRVELVPNATEVDFIPPGYRHAPAQEPRIIGYFGHLSTAWFDWDAFLAIARLRPQYRFEVLGHSAPPGLVLPENVALLGPRPWRQLHEIARHWSVAVIPFRMGKLADGVDPIKIYEYLSLGLPVVSFRMPQIADYPYTTTVNTVPDFCTALDHACEITTDPVRIRDFITHNTWEKRAEQLLLLADEYR